MLGILAAIYGIGRRVSVQNLLTCLTFFAKTMFGYLYWIWIHTHLKTAVTVDIFGNKLTTIGYGRDTVDETLTKHTEPTLIATPAQPYGDSHYAWRTSRTWITGSAHGPTPFKLTKTTYNDRGEPVKTEAYTEGTAPLIRANHAGQPPPAPVGAIEDGWHTASETTYDAAGNAIFTWTAGNHCAQVTYDADYSHLPVAETMYAGAEGALSVDGNTYTCGTTALTSQASYDRGYQVPLQVTDINGGVSKMVLDALGRMTELYGPSATTPGQTQPLPSLKIKYHLPDETKMPVSLLEKRTLDGADDNDAQYHETYAYVDGLGRTLLTLSEADPAIDGFAWVVQGMTDYDAKGAARRKYLAWSFDGDPLSPYILQAFAHGVPAKYGQQQYDAFGRSVRTWGLDGHLNLVKKYHGLSTDIYDAEDLGPGPHAGTYASGEKDGHGRTIRTTDRVHTTGNQIEERYSETSYDPLGNPVKLTRRRGAQSTSRTLVYTTQGQLVINRLPGLAGPQNQGFRYAYDASGQLVGTSDPRGCGVNFAYDAAGRLLTEDYIPCEEHHAKYTPAPEVTYHYDTPDPEQSQAFTAPSAIQVGTQNCQTTNFTQGRLVSVTDRAQKTVTCFDGKGRSVETAKNLRLPTYSPIDPPTWSDTWHRKRVAYDGASRVFQETTGATQNTAPGNHQSIITTVYSRRGAVARVDSSYGPLVTKIKRGPNGKPLEITYGDAASTTTSYTYDDLERTRTATTFRARPSAWGPAQNDPLASKTRQLLLQDLEYTYDRVGNPVKIRDWRDPWDWPAGAKPVTRKMAYDDLYRLNKIEYTHEPGQDTWLDPFEAEHQTGPSFEKPSPSPRADFSGSTRVARQTYQYDWLGNTTSTGDDQGAFYDRSLGQIQNGGAGASPYQLRHASNESGSSARPGHLDAQYDAMGNMVAMQVHRVGKCRPASACPGNQLDQSFFYRWDEVGRLVGAERFDGILTSVHPAMGQRVDASMKYSYDASDQRVMKFSIVGSNDAARMLMTAYIFNTLELRHTNLHYEGTGQPTHFEQNQDTEAVYLFGHGVRLGRVVYAMNAAVPMVDQKMVQVLLELGDALGSTSVVLQRGSGELVERTEHLAYGGVDSDYRPDRWGAFREPYKFTGKEEDVEVGLVYFGKRFYAPLLGRWVSADPLVVHVPGRADANLYAYVRGRVFVAVDLVGLDEDHKLVRYYVRQISRRMGDMGAPTELLRRISQPRDVISGIGMGTKYFNFITNALHIGGGPNVAVTRRNHVELPLSAVRAGNAVLARVSGGRIDAYSHFHEVDSVSTVYHESVHHFFNTTSRLSATNIMKHARAYYASKGVANPGDVASEAFAYYVGKRIRTWIWAKAEMQRAKSLARRGKFVEAMNEWAIAKRVYTSGMSQRVFGVDKSGNDTTVPISKRMKVFADSVLLEGKILDSFDTTFKQDIKELGRIGRAVSRRQQGSNHEN